MKKPPVLLATGLLAGLLSSFPLHAQVKAACSVQCNDGSACSTATDYTLKREVETGASIEYTLDEGLGQASYHFAFAKGAAVDYERVRQYVLNAYYEPETSGKLGERVNLLKQGQDEAAAMALCLCSVQAGGRQARCTP